MAEKTSASVSISVHDTASAEPTNIPATIRRMAMTATHLTGAALMWPAMNTPMTSTRRPMPIRVSQLRLRTVDNPRSMPVERNIPAITTMTSPAKAIRFMVSALGKLPALVDALGPRHVVRHGLPGLRTHIYPLRLGGLGRGVVGPATRAAA